MRFYQIRAEGLPRLRHACSVDTCHYANRFVGNPDYIELSVLTEGFYTLTASDGTVRRFEAHAVVNILPDFVGQTETPVGLRNCHVCAGAKMAYTYQKFDTDTLDGETAEALLASAREETVFLLPETCPAEGGFATLQPALERISRQFCRGDEGSRAAASARFLLVLAELTRSVAEVIRRTRGEGVSPAAMLVADRAVSYLTHHYRERVTAADVAREVGLSVNYLHRVFEKAKGVSLFTYLTAFRMEQAKNLARVTDAPAYEIAAQVGIPDPLYFSRVFKRTQGITFAEYRRNGT